MEKTEWKAFDNGNHALKRGKKSIGNVLRTKDGFWGIAGSQNLGNFDALLTAKAMVEKAVDV